MSVRSRPMHASRDVEATANDLQPLDGFPSLAAFIASDHDRSSLVFKRFDKLAARNLLYLQSELMSLQKMQEVFDQEDQGIDTGDLESKACAMNWDKFDAEASSGRNPRQQRRMELVQMIRVKLKEYRKVCVEHTSKRLESKSCAGEALLFESTLAVLNPPPKRTYDALYHASTRMNESTKSRDAILGGHSRNLYTSNEDLVLLKQPEHEDRFTAFVHQYLPVFFMTGKTQVDGMAYVSERNIARFVSIISILVAVILLFVAIITLYLISKPAKKLGMIGVYISLFASSVGLFTTAKRSEVFAATAAYAAVLVVFVSGNLGSKS